MLSGVLIGGRLKSFWRRATFAGLWIIWFETLDRIFDHLLTSMHLSHKLFSLASLPACMGILKVILYLIDIEIDQLFFIEFSQSHFMFLIILFFFFNMK